MFLNLTSTLLTPEPKPSQVRDPASVELWLEEARRNQTHI